MTDLGALKRALAAEDAIVYGYGVAGAYLSGRERAIAAARLLSHQNRRDRVAALITALGAVPPSARPAYRLPFPVTDAVSARQLAAHLENGGAGAAWGLAASTTERSTARRLAVSWLSDAAVAASHWGLALSALPGRP